MTVAADLRPDPALAARAAAARPAMMLDTDAVLGAAHGHSARRTARRVVGGVTALAAACAVAVSVAGTDFHTRATPAWRTSGPTSTDQIAQSIGEGDLATMSGGVRAVNIPGPARPPSSGARAALPGATVERDLALVGPDGTSVALLTSGPGTTGDAGLKVAYVDDSGTPVSGESPLPGWTWGADASANVATWAIVAPDATHRLDAALAPSDLKSPRTYYWTSDDADIQIQEMPTFDTGNGRLVTVFTTTGEQPQRSGLAYVGADGQIVEAPCPATIRCASLDSIPGLRDQLSLDAFGPEWAQETGIFDQAVEDAKRQLADATTAKERAAAEAALAAAQANADLVTISAG